MRILYDHQIFFSQQYGGISRYFYELISRIVAKKTNHVDLFQGLNINKYGLEKHKSQFQNYCGFQHAPIPRTGRLCNILNDLGLNIFAKGKSYDIYHQTYYHTHLANINCNRIVTVYDMIHELFTQQFSPDDNTSYIKKNAVMLSNGIIAISHSTKKDLINLLDVPEEKIRVIHLANSLTEIVNDEALVKKPYILYVGTRGGYKNFRMLAEAYADCQYKKDVVLVCFGGGEFSNNEHRFFNELGITSRVELFQGNDSILANLYKYAQGFVYPSLYEGFGIPPLEAMHYGCPVIASNVSSIPEVVGEAGLYFTPLDREDLILKINQVLNSKDLRKLLSIKGQSHEKNFSWDLCAEQTLDFYESF
jgi:glycosyltransferase involved in cell wall biosynthesis